MELYDEAGNEVVLVMSVLESPLEIRTSLDQECAICKAPVSGMDLCQACHDRVANVIAADLARKNVQATLDMHRERGASVDQDSDSTGFK